MFRHGGCANASRGGCCAGGGSCGRVRDHRVRADDGAAAELRPIDVPRTEDMADDLVAREEVVGDDPSMASPPHALRAHDRDAPRATLGAELIEGASEIRGQGVIGVVVEAAVLPPRVGLEGHVPAHRASTRQRLFATVGDPRVLQGRSQRVLVELRVPLRAGETPHVDDTLHAALLHEPEELVDRAGGVPDGEERLRHEATVAHSSPSTDDPCPAAVPAPTVR